jgi:hypothetical protein
MTFIFECENNILRKCAASEYNIVFNTRRYVMFCLLYCPQAKNCINTKSHVIDIFTSEDMENMSLCISQYLTLTIMINVEITQQTAHAHISPLLRKFIQSTFCLWD